MKIKDWELSFGFYPGLLIGFRTYNEEGKNNHVLYIQAAREELRDLSEESLIQRCIDEDIEEQI